MPKQKFDTRDTIRGLDPVIKKKARQDAIAKGITLGVWLNQAIANKLKLWDKSRKGIR